VSTEISTATAAPTAGTTFFRRHRWKILLIGFVAAVVAVA